MALSHEIWDDLRIRMENIRADMVGQWSGDFTNTAVEHAVTSLGATIQTWALAEPVVLPPDPPPP